MSLFAHRLPKHPGLLRHQQLRAASVQNRIADWITGFSGSMVFVYIHAILFGLWLWRDGGPFHDPFPYGLLTMVVSLEAIFLSTFVLISQNRADLRRQELADHEWELVQREDLQNQELLRLSGEVLNLTKEVHRLTSEIHGRVAPPTDERAGPSA